MWQVGVIVTVPVSADLGVLEFAITAENGNSGSEPTSAFVNVVNRMDVSIWPPVQTAVSGTPVSYTLTITNWSDSSQNYNLSIAGVAEVTPSSQSMTVPGNSSASQTLMVIANSDGPHGFSVTAVADTSNASDSDSAVLIGVGDRSVAVTLNPETAVIGRGSSTVYAVTVTNLGTVADSYDLEVTLPNNWDGELRLNGTPIDTLDLPPYVYNSFDLQLYVTSSATASPGDYPLSVEATSMVDSIVTSEAEGIATVLNKGVQIEIVSGPTVIGLGETAVWDIEVTNTGQVQDSYELIAAGVVAWTGEFIPMAVTLNPGESQTIELSADLSFMVAGNYPFAVAAQSTSEPAVMAEDNSTITISSEEGLVLEWLPAIQTITNTVTATFQLSISNTGNIGTLYDLNLALGQLTPVESTSRFVYLPANIEATFDVVVIAPGEGEYELVGTAVSESGFTEQATATLHVVTDTEPDNLTLYLPFIMTDNE